MTYLLETSLTNLSFNQTLPNEQSVPDLDSLLSIAVKTFEDYLVEKNVEYRTYKLPKHDRLVAQPNMHITDSIDLYIFLNMDIDEQIEAVKKLSKTFAQFLIDGEYNLDIYCLSLDADVRSPYTPLVPQLRIGARLMK